MSAKTLTQNKNAVNKSLAINLAQAESEEEVIQILKKVNHWDDDSSWRPYGGDEGNFATIGGQQSSAENALIEKFTNSTDAMILKECHLAGIDPESEKAPQSIEEALDKFHNIKEGKIATLSMSDRRALAGNIGFVATGEKSKPNYVFFDKGIGQSPGEFEDTFLSLKTSNKLKIKCLMGKFNQGSTGVLPFSGEHNLQLIISKKFPEGRNTLPDGEEWGITVVRREDPKGNAKSSVYTYLKPKDKILSFKADGLPILPSKYPEPYGQPLKSGSFIKVFNYATKHKTIITFDLFYRLNALLPNPALPIKFYERRKGYKANSFETTLLGLETRFTSDRNKNIEPNFPATASLNVKGEKMNVKIYAFKHKKSDIQGKKGAIKDYVGNDGVIFSYFGQTQGTESNRFFKRKAVNLSYASDYLAVTVDCSDISIKAKDSLFMSSRDRLREGDFYNQIIKQLESLLKNHKGLRSFQEKKRNEFLTKDLSDSKPLEEVLQKVLKNSPVLASILGDGDRLSNPTKGVRTKQKKVYKGKQFPTFFRPEKKFTQLKPKHAPLNVRWRVQFLTDVTNDYLDRISSPGKSTLFLNGQEVYDYTINFFNGYAYLNVGLPNNSKEGDVLKYTISVDDVSQVRPFEHEVWIKVTKAVKKTNKPKPPYPPKPPASSKSGTDTQSNALMAMPNAMGVKMENWEKYGFDKYSALHVKHSGKGNVYDYYYNVDNFHLLHEKKRVSESEGEVIDAQYRAALVLIGMMILQEKNNSENSGLLEDKGEFVSVATRIISPMIIPMLHSLGGLGKEL